ncbi:hypothetical protein DY000_02042049 [Brassica cretica]|uniref:Uncharacterized protein n=1 Tax=Brassica cretica TaxID=69181 RepID=A0ABQ7BEU2_BRACR|nr:hypothetical protein DY000_02042049 [Brassica cretica]
MRLIIAFKFVDVIGYMDGNDMWNSYTNCNFSMGHVSNRLDKRGKFMYSSVEEASKRLDKWSNKKLDVVPE